MEKKYYYWLHNVPGIGNRTIKRLLEITTPRQLYEEGAKLLEQNCFDSNQEAEQENFFEKFFQHTEEMIENPLKKYTILRPSQIQSLEESRKQWNVDKQWETLEKLGINLSYWGSEDYPKPLLTIPDAPMILYEKGKGDWKEKPAIAVVGTRNCSPYGNLAAKELGRELAERGIVVVSGMARGIDGICQYTALKEQGCSVGVLGSGVEICYPPENKGLYDMLVKQGAVISENPPFTQPKAGLFPLRNRIISGLADVIVVVESKEKSGTLITVDMALEQGKDVYAMPGRMTDAWSRGCNKLIKQGAGIVLSPREFVEEIYPFLLEKYEKQMKKEKYSLGIEKRAENRNSFRVEKKQEFTEDEKIVLEILDLVPKPIEEIYYQVKVKRESLTLQEVMEILLQLRIKKIVDEEGQYYFRV